MRKSSPIGICVVGSGRAGMIHARNFVRDVPNARLVAVADPAQRAAQAACDELGIAKAYRSHTDALEDREIDAFIVVAPTELHCGIVKDLANAKKHILCEKPMAMTAAECDEMIQAAEENGVLLQIGFMRRFDAGFKRAKQILDSGAIGDVVMVRSNTRGPSVPQPWMYDIKKSNGPLAEVCSHDIDALRWFTGSEFQTIYALGGNFRCREVAGEFPDFYDNVIVSASFQNGCQGAIDGAQGVGYAYDSRAEILGTKGCIFVGRLQEESVTVHTAETHSGSFPAVASWRTLFSEAYLSEDRAFVESIVSETPAQVTGHDGKMAVAAVNAGNISIAEKRIVTV